MKKRIALWLSGLLVLSFVGCGRPTTLEESVAASSAETVIEENSSEESSSEESSSAESSSEESLSEGSGQEETTSEEATEASSEPEEENPAEGLSLKELFAEHGMKVGTCLTPQMIINTKISGMLLNQFSSVTMENAMKPDYLFNKKESIASGELVVEFNKDALQMMEYAKENGLAMRGHTLVWYSQTPNWIFYEDFDTKKGLVSRSEMLERLESYTKQVFETLDSLGYSDLFYAYDVANEAWMEDGSLRENNWSKTIGDDYLWYAFYFADKYAPEHIDLYYNDYNEQFKTQTLVDFVNTLVDEDGNYLIDGIGFQAHLYTSDDLVEYFKTVDALGETGLKMELTELDVSLGAWQNTLEATEDNLKAQGKFYYDLINGLFERQDAGTIHMDALTFWGFVDSMSWRKEASPLLYDKTCQPKYSFYGAMQMKEQAGIEE